jgi:hypothetical protein
MVGPSSAHEAEKIMRTIHASVLASVLAVGLIAGLFAPASFAADEKGEFNPKKDLSELGEADKLEKNLQDLKKMMADAGFTDVQLSHALILQAKDKAEQKVMLLLDPTTMTAIELRNSPGETTGSGSGEDHN